MEICDRTLSDEIKAALRLPAFDSYEWEDEDVLYLMQTMFIDTGLVDKFNIPLPTLREWLYEVYKHYNAVPFHNFRHCFCVAQMVSQNQTYSQHASFVLCVRAINKYFCRPIYAAIFDLLFFSVVNFYLHLLFICFLLFFDSLFLARVHTKHKRYNGFSPNMSIKSDLFDGFHI